MSSAEINGIYSFLFGNLYRVVGVIYTCWYVWLFFVRLYPRLAYLHDLENGLNTVVEPDDLYYMKKSVFRIFRAWIIMKIFDEVIKKK